MTVFEFKELNRGDIVYNNASGNSYIIEGLIPHLDGDCYIAVRAITITNPAEWSVVSKSRKVEK